MNPVDTLKLVLDHQAAMRRQARINALARSARQRHHGFSVGPRIDDDAGTTGLRRDPIGAPRFVDQ
jgi:hypothetical protein